MVAISSFSHTAYVIRSDDNDSHDRGFRVLYAVVSMGCMFWLALLFGSRIKQLKVFNFKAWNWLRAIVTITYICAVCFIFSTSILMADLGLTSGQDCYTAIILCLVFYIGTKILIYMFLVERAHVIRAPHKRRQEDMLWVICMAIVILGFGAIAAAAFIWPIAEVSSTDGKCRIGVPLKVTAPFLAYDMVINIALTSLFVYFLYPLLAFKRNDDPSDKFRISPSILIRHQTRKNDRIAEKLRKLIWKTIIGGILVMLPTVANIVIFFIMRGSEEGWLCFTICSIDVVWSITILHWLTVDRQELDQEASQSLHPPIQPSPRQDRSSHELSSPPARPASFVKTTISSDRRDSFLDAPPLASSTNSIFKSLSFQVTCDSDHQDIEPINPKSMTLQEALRSV